MSDFESGSTGRGNVPRTQGVTCGQGVDHKGGACLCGPPKDTFKENGATYDAKVDTRTGKRYGIKKR
jgi:hypothetical protein